MEILNRGRGAGKSHALALWQLEDPANRRIVTNEYNLEQYFQLGVSTVHVYTYKQAAEGRLRGFYGAVGFDDFDGYIKKVITNQLNIDVFRSDDSTILVTTLAESELLPGPKELPANPDYAAKIYYYLNEKLPGAAALLGVVTPEEDPEAGFTRGIWKDKDEDPEAGFTRGIWKDKDEAPTPVEAEKVIKRMDELCIGDYIEGKGTVIGLTIDSKSSNFISADVKETGFTGTLRKLSRETVEVRPKK